MDVLRVSGHSRPNSVAGAVAALLRSEGRLEMQAIGPQAVNQAVKALAIARSYVEEDELDLISAPSFVTLELHDEERTALRFHVRAVPRADGIGAEQEADPEADPADTPAARPAGTAPQVDDAVFSPAPHPDLSNPE